MSIGPPRLPTNGMNLFLMSSALNVSGCWRARVSEAGNSWAVVQVWTIATAKKNSRSGGIRSLWRCGSARNTIRWMLVGLWFELRVGERSAASARELTRNLSGLLGGDKESEDRRSAAAHQGEFSAS